MKILNTLLVAAMLFGISSKANAIELPDPVVAAMEQYVDSAVRAAVGTGRSGSVGALDRIDWRVSFASQTMFAGDPVVTCNNAPCESIFGGLGTGFTISVFVPLDLALDAHGHIHFPILADWDGDARIRKSIGATLTLPVVRNGLSFTPDLDAAAVALTDGGGNVNVTGITGEFIRVGSLAGGAVFGVTGFAAGAFVGWLSGDEAQDRIKREIRSAFSRQLNKASQELTRRLRTELAARKDEIVGTLTALLLNSVKS